MSKIFVLQIQEVRNDASNQATIYVITPGASGEQIGFNGVFVPWLQDSTINNVTHAIKEDEFYIKNSEKMEFEIDDYGNAFKTWADAQADTQSSSVHTNFKFVGAHCKLWWIDYDDTSTDPDIFQYKVAGLGDVYGIKSDGTSVWVIENSTAILKHLVSTGAYSTEYDFTSQSGSVSGIAIDGSGNMFVSDLQNHRILKYNSSGVFQGWFGKCTDVGSAEYHVAASGHTPASGSNNGEFDTPYDLFVSGTDLYVVDKGNDRIQKFDISVTIAYTSKYGTTGTGNTNFDEPFGICVDSAGDILVSDYDNNRVKRISSGLVFESHITSAFGKDLSKPSGLAVDGSDNIFVLDYGNNRVVKFDSSNNAVNEFGSFGYGNLQYRQLHFAGISGNYLYLTDINNTKFEKIAINTDPNDNLVWEGYLKSVEITDSPVRKLICEPIAQDVMNERVIKGASKLTYDGTDYIQTMPFTLNTTEDAGLKCQMIIGDTTQDKRRNSLFCRDGFTCIGQDENYDDIIIDQVIINGEDIATDHTIADTDQGVVADYTSHAYGGDGAGDDIIRWFYADNGDNVAANACTITNNGRWVYFQVYNGAAWEVLDNNNWWDNGLNLMTIRLRQNGFSAAAAAPANDYPASFIHYMLCNYTRLTPASSWTTNPNLWWSNDGTDGQFTYGVGTHINMYLTFMTLNEDLTVKDVIKFICDSCGGYFWIDHKSIPHLYPVFWSSPSADHTIDGTSGYAPVIAGSFKRVRKMNDTDTTCGVRYKYMAYVNEDTSYTGYQGDNEADYIYNAYALTGVNRADALQQKYAAMIALEDYTFEWKMPMFWQGSITDYMSWAIGEVVEFTNFSHRSLDLTVFITGVKHDFKKGEITFSGRIWD